jgi:hypothetical protein
MQPIRVALALFFAAPGVALASPSLVARDLPVLSGAVAQAPNRFDLVGLHWQGGGTVRFRTQSTDGRWSKWRVSAPESDDLPDRNSREARRSRGWHLGNPYWVGSSLRIQYRPSPSVRRLRAFFVRSPLVRPKRLKVQPFSTTTPQIITRAQWHANEAIRRDRTARYADAVHLAIVHHTAGSNSYSPSQSASIVRAVELYHVLGNGWDDIGYNFLVDKYGQVFEGRWGGMEKPVVGAHAMGFNYGSVGVALIGNYNGAGLTPAERASLVKLLSWRLDASHVDPLSRVTRLSTGNPRYHLGTPVQLRAISGHRDTYATSCPGNSVYAQLPSIARQVAASGLPKIYSPVVLGAPGGKVHFTARLSSVVPWTVTVSDALGHVVASGAGRGRAVDWTWDSSLAPRGRYTYRIGAGGSGAAAARPATGAIATKPLPQLSITQLRVQPGVVSPNGDRIGDTARISYRLGAPASVSITLADSTGNLLASLFSGGVPGGAHVFVWRQVAVPDGRYTISISARGANGKQVSGKTTFYVDRTLAEPKLTAAAISPNGDGFVDDTMVSFRLNAPASVRVELWRSTKLLAVLFDRALGYEVIQLPWTGRIGAEVVADGQYELVVKATDALTTVTQTLPVRVDLTPPKLRVVSRAKLLFRSSEPATIAATFDGRRLTKRVRRGYFSFPLVRRALHFALTATDAVGNTSRPLRG